MFRFLHIADIHLDTTFLCRTDDLRSRLRASLRTAFGRAVDCALEEKVHAVLIAGDLFDNERLSFTTEQFLLEQCHRLHQADIACFYVTGNHDPGGQGGRARSITWPDSFHYISQPEPQIIAVHDPQGTLVAKVVGAGHLTNRESSNLASQFPKAEGDVAYVGLLHTMVTSAQSVEDHDRYAPCAVEDLQTVDYGYWALGHIHARQQVCPRAHAWYPGNIQGRNPRETDPKGGLLVSMEKGRPPNVEFRSFAPLHWKQIELNELEAVENLQGVEDRAHQALQEIRASQATQADDWLLRFVLSGACPLASDLADTDQRTELEETLVQTLEVADVEIRIEQLTPPVEVDRYRNEPHLLSEILAVIDEAAANPDILTALASDEQSHIGRVGEEQGDYLRQLLEGLDREAVVRLLIEGHDAH